MGRMGLKETLMMESAKLASNPAFAKLMADERFMKLLVTAMSMPGRVYSFTQEQKENFAKTMGLASADEVKDLRRTVAALEERLARYEKRDSEP